METLIEIICIISEKNGRFIIFALFVIEIVSLNSNLNYSVPVLLLFLAIWQWVIISCPFIHMCFHLLIL